MIVSSVYTDIKVASDYDLTLKQFNDFQYTCQIVKNSSVMSSEPGR
jgi:hypothetical protein